MTTIRNQRVLRRIIDHATPADRLRCTAGMGNQEPEPRDFRRPSRVVCWLAFALFVAGMVVAHWFDRWSL